MFQFPKYNSTNFLESWKTSPQKKKRQQKPTKSFIEAENEYTATMQNLHISLNCYKKIFAIFPNNFLQSRILLVSRYQFIPSVVFLISLPGDNDGCIYCPRDLSIITEEAIDLLTIYKSLPFCNVALNKYWGPITTKRNLTDLLSLMSSVDLIFVQAVSRQFTQLKSFFFSLFATFRIPWEGWISLIGIFIVIFIF